MKNFRVFNLILAFSIILLVSCSNIEKKFSKKPSKEHSISFFYWKVKFDPGKEDRDFLDRLGTKKIYARFFDVVWDAGKKQALPADKIIFDTGKIKYEIIPVVFLTSKTLENIESGKIPELSSNIAKEIAGLSEKNDLRIKEIIIDNDWTKLTGDKYFKLLRYIKKYFGDNGKNIRVSSTVRLHQLKYYRETGVPPVETGYLMIYNTFSPTDYTDKNTIFDVNSVKRYVNTDRYPVKLTACFPLFSWAIQYDANKKFIRLYEGINGNDLKNNVNFRKSGNIFTAANDSDLMNKKVFKGDFIKFDGIKTSDIKKIFGIISQKKLYNNEIIFYNYDTDSLKKQGLYDVKKIKGIIDR
jgi:hypothetical protein